MKKLVLFVMVVMAFAGMSVAQDIYSSGYYIDDNGIQQSAVYKNRTRISGSSYTNTDFSAESTDLDVYDEDVYWVNNASLAGNFYYADVMKNSYEYYLNSPTGEGRHIYDLHRMPDIGLYSVGCMDINAVRTAVVWKDDNPDVYYQLGNGTWPSIAYGATSDEDDSFLYTCGVQYGLEETTYHGVIWQDHSVYITFPDSTKILDVTYHNGNLYSVGYAYEEGYNRVKVWENDQPIYTLHHLGIDNLKISIDDAGDIYVSGFCFLWKNSTLLYSFSGMFSSVTANTNGVYAAAHEGYVGKIMKDGEVLFVPDECYSLCNLFIEELTCEDEAPRPLPYFEGFETGNTDWNCWLKEDVDAINEGVPSYWCRIGENIPHLNPATGQYCAMHHYGPSGIEQEGWLASPLIRIPQGGGDVKLTFKSAEYYPEDYVYEGVWVASESIPDGEELWVASPDFVSEEWKTVELNLSPYKGMDIRVFFEYTGNYAHVWFVDDVNIEQGAGPASYTITTEVDPVGAGTVAGGGTYPEGTEVTLTATANTGYIFSQWQDGNTDNPRQVIVNGDETYTAYFTTGGGGTLYTVTVVSENPLLGSVTGGGTYPEGAVTQISATPSPSARFVSWDDGNTDNPRTITVTGDVTYTAKFEALQNYTITVVSANPTMGSATGGGTFMEGTVINISATPLTGYYFIGWDDGNADNPRSITVTQDATYIAQFASAPVQTFTLTVLCNSAEGSTVGSGTYTAGSTATIAAIPNSGFLFDKWNDDNTDNPRQVVVNSDMTFVAFFKGTGVGEDEGRMMVLYPNPATDHVRIEGIEANSEVRIYNAMGALVKVTNASANEEIGIGELSDGLYLLRCGNVTFRFVKM